MEQLAKLNPTEYNYLGVEIREALVNDANERWQREHVCHIFCVRGFFWRLIRCSCCCGSRT